MHVIVHNVLRKKSHPMQDKQLSGRGDGNINEQLTYLQDILN